MVCQFAVCWRVGRAASQETPPRHRPEIGQFGMPEIRAFASEFPMEALRLQTFAGSVTVLKQRGI